jgi:hypothetical protein
VLALRVCRAVAALVLCAIALLATGTGRARAGAWTLVSCSQPNGQPAPTDGWTTGDWAGAVTAYSGDSNTCAQPGGALTAESNAAGPAASYTGPEWIFTAPAGSTIAGGSVSASLTSPQGQTWIGTPGPAYDGADVIVNCGLNESCGANGTLSGTFPITHPGGTAIYAPAICVDFTSSACPQTGPTPNAEVSITRAEIELSVPAVPDGEDFTGTLLDRGARGTADLVFNAVDSAVGGGFGPGIHRVSATIDGRTVESGVPDLNGGACVPLGTDPATGGLMFDHAQPCPAEASVTIPVSTAPLSDGRHQLAVTLSDAAGNVATVLSRTITTSNPVTSPRPIRPFEVAARLTMGWMFTGPRTRLDSAHATDLPATGTITVACSGPRCPRLALRTVSAAHVGRMWSELKHATLHAGDRLELTIRASRRRPEPIQFHIRSGRPPTARLLRSR